MEELFKELAGHIALGIEAVAVIVIAVGSIEAVINGLRIVATRARAAEMREMWMRYARWLVAGLTFQLAGDIVHTAVAPTWDEIGRLGAIAVIRTFLAYFLDRDMEERRRLRQPESMAEKP
jgi:uncharacterized membrane protein